MERENIAFKYYVEECLHDVYGQWEKISVLQRAKALVSALVLWNVKVEGRDINGD